VDYTSVKEKLIQSWRYKTLAVIGSFMALYITHSAALNK